MPSGTTPNLGLTLPSIMGDASIWGQELNGNFSIIDTAFGNLPATIKSSDNSILLTDGAHRILANIKGLGAAGPEYVYIWLGANAAAPTGTNFSIIADTTDTGAPGFADLTFNTNQGNIGLSVDGTTAFDIGTRTGNRLNVPAGYGYHQNNPARINAFNSIGSAVLANGQLYFYLDEAGNNLRIRTKYSTAALHLATLPLDVTLSPAGSPSTSVQFNNSGVLAGDASFEWDNTNKGLVIGAPAVVNPFVALTINGDNYNSPIEVHSSFAVGMDLYSHSNTNFRAPTIGFFRSGGTQASPTVVQGSWVLAHMGVSGYNGSAYAAAGLAQMITTEVWTLTANGSKWQFFTNVTGTLTNVETLTLTGHFVGCDNTSPKFVLHTSSAAVALGAPSSAPTDSDLNNNNISFYLDQVGNNLKVRVKYSDGTLKLATIALA